MQEIRELTSESTRCSHEVSHAYSLTYRQRNDQLLLPTTAYRVTQEDNVLGIPLMDRARATLIRGGLALVWGPVGL